MQQLNENRARPGIGKVLGNRHLPLSGAGCNFPLDATVISPSFLAAGGS